MHQVPARVSRKRFVALCLIALTLVLLAIPDEEDLQAAVVAGLQSFSDGGDDVNDVDDGDGNGKYTTLPAVFGVLHGDRVFGHYHLGGKVVLLERVNMGDSISPRGPPPTVRRSMTHASPCFLVLLPHIVCGSTHPRRNTFSCRGGDGVCFSGHTAVATVAKESHP